MYGFVHSRCARAAGSTWRTAPVSISRLILSRLDKPGPEDGEFEALLANFT
jgi:hypothetical protein